MGAWGTGIFENDDAADFLAEVAEFSSFDPIEGAIDQVLQTGQDFLEAPDASRAIVAAAMLAHIKDPKFELATDTTEIDQWIARTSSRPDSALFDKARQALGRVMIEPSELLELWRESGELEEWKASVRKVASRL